MSNATPTCFRLDDLSIDLTRQCVTRADVVLDVAGLSFRLLACLLPRGVDGVPFDTLIAEVWAPAVVNVAERLTQQLHALGHGPRRRLPRRARRQSNRRRALRGDQQVWPRGRWSR
jgi:DNA-binding winged helix-turn-helix (wHTH) protein